MSTDRELPPLPEPAKKLATDTQRWVLEEGATVHVGHLQIDNYYTAEQMRARDALIAEDCAKLVESLRPCMRGDCDDLAAAIRARYKAG